MTTELSTEIMNELDALNPESKRKVLDFIHSLKEPKPGMSGSSLNQFVGILSDVDTLEMMDAIKSGCEKFDFDEW